MTPQIYILTMNLLYVASFGDQSMLAACALANILILGFLTMPVKTFNGAIGVMFEEKCKEEEMDLYGKSS